MFYGQCRGSGAEWRLTKSCVFLLRGGEKEGKKGEKKGVSGAWVLGEESSKARLGVKNEGVRRGGRGEK